VGQNCVISKI